MRSLRSLVVGLAWSVSVVSGAAQDGVLTNADVVKMVKAGLSESIVVSAINRAGMTAFDLEPDALIKLKTDGVTDATLTAMMAKAASAAPATKPAPPAVSPLPDAPLEVLVPENTELTVRLVRPVTSANARVEDKVDLEVVRDVVIDGVVVFKKGAPARGTVTAAANARSFGRSGNLAFTIESVEAVNGQAVRLDTNRALKGETRAGATVAAVVLVGVFGGFVKGKNIEVPAGTEYVTYTVGDRRLNLSNVPASTLAPAINAQPQSPPAMSTAPVSVGLVGAWNISLPNTTVTVEQRPNGMVLLALRGQYNLRGELTGSGQEFSGTVTNACMPRRPITMVFEAGGWTARTEHADCVNNGQPLRTAFRLTR